MANTSTSPASSSAVTIPTPGKSILKRPPPPPQSLLSRLSRLLPTQNTPVPNGVIEDDAKTLKRAHFILPQMSTVYPILAANPPCTPAIKEEKKIVEEKEAERRRRVVRGNSVNLRAGPSDLDEWWSMDKVESFYKECCAGREEDFDLAISSALKRAASPDSRTVDLSGIQLTIASASVLSDVFTIEWGLRKLIFKECDLDENNMKPMLHALLIPESLHFISVASNKRMKAPAFRLLGAYVLKAKSLQFLDLSQNSLDKKSIEYIAAALAVAPAPGLVSLRADDCFLRPAALEALAHAVRTSSLRNISLRHNRITATGAVALALMIKDYPDTIPSNNSLQIPSTPSLNSSIITPPMTPAGTPPQPVSPLPSTPTLAPKVGPVLPPPRHPKAVATQTTTYTPYIPRAKRAPAALTGSLSPTSTAVPIITSNAQGGITTRHSTTPSTPSFTPTSATSPNGHHQGPSAALLDKVRALDTLPRLGALRTLDLKGNDIRGGVTYIAQVLKRNRTLKVLNLSENKLDVQGLVAIAEALKYNSSLETLDMSKNPCCGPGLEGIQSLRTAFTLNSALKRLFLSSTQLTSAGAIALAEFLPESNSLLHLDLTNNNLDLAGVMALSGGLKANFVMRCLDLNIPPGDEQMARMCRDILNSCVRNTEDAEKISGSIDGSIASGTTGSTRRAAVWGMIDESELAKTIRRDFDKPTAWNKEQVELVKEAREIKSRLEELTLRSPSSSFFGMTSTKESDPELTKKANAVVTQLQKLIQTSAVNDSSKLEELLNLNDSLRSLLVPPTPSPSASAVSPKGKNKGFGLGISIPPANGDDHQVDILSPEAFRSDDDTPLAELQFANGHSPAPKAKDGDGEEEVVSTPRMDKGKGRAEPEPERPVPVLRRPSFALDDEEEEDPATVIPETLPGVSPVMDRSRSWVEEEGEVFRKGTVLLGPEEMEGEYAGDDLRKELLDAMVERPPPRDVQDDEFSIPLPESLPSSPITPQSADPSKAPPRPYIRRSRSSSNGINSPSISQAFDDGDVTPTTPGSPLLLSGFISASKSP